MSGALPGVVGTVVLVVLVYLALCARFYIRMTRIPPDAPAFRAPDTPAAFEAPPVDTGPFLMPRFETVQFPSRTHTVGIRGWWIPAEGHLHAPAVIVVHGLESCRRDGRVLLTAGMLHRHGFGVLALDLRNHGESGRDTGRHAGGLREAADVLGGWDWLVDDRRSGAGAVGLLGISLGAATVLIGAGDEPRVAAVWADSAYGDLEDVSRAELRRNHLPSILLYGGRLAARLLDGPGLRSRSPLRAMARLAGRPVFITHGTADTRLDVHFADQLIGAGEAAGARVERWIVEGAGHTDAIVDDPAGYERRMAAFFGHHLHVDPR